jgi:hypothetical protein
MNRIPINTDVGGLSRCVKAGYYKMGWTNFTREILGARDGFTATAIMEVYEEGDTDKHDH